ncbi:hypothetical protein SK128_020672 [Halocaridina rubra]|uniref:Uncharacterized protein n=1 Tax=Halocaridina rubra TaxID=373956 RepID=A0AAN8X619_HALRR
MVAAEANEIAKDFHDATLNDSKSNSATKDDDGGIGKSTDPCDTGMQHTKNSSDGDINIDNEELSTPSAESVNRDSILNTEEAVSDTHREIKLNHMSYVDVQEGRGISSHMLSNIPKVSDEIISLLSSNSGNANPKPRHISGAVHFSSTTKAARLGYMKIKEVLDLRDRIVPIMTKFGPSLYLPLKKDNPVPSHLIVTGASTDQLLKENNRLQQQNSQLQGVLSYLNERVQRRDRRSVLKLQFDGKI